VEFTIAPATHDDAEEYVHGHVGMLISTYAHLMGPDFSVIRRGEITDRIGWLHDDIDEASAALAAGREPHRAHLVARNTRGGMVGLACSGIGCDSWEEEVCGDAWTPPATDRILDHLYTVPGTHGSGLGQALLDASLPGRRPAYLWVLSENTRAVRFYERNGFTADGLQVSTGETWGERPMHRMTRT